MFHIKTFNSIAKKGLEVFEPNLYQFNSDEQPDAILLRSYDLHGEHFGANLKAVARAGAGVNNIPIDKLSEQGVVVFNTPGANANAVKEIVIMSLIASSRNLFKAVNWTKTLLGQGDVVPHAVEEGKKSFVGTEIRGKRLGVVGVGAIGVLVANDALALGMEVMAFDPFISVNTAWQLSRDVQRAERIEEIFRTCDYITLHVPLTSETRGILNKDTFALMKPNVHILNFSRGELVNADDLELAMEEQRIAAYITDFPTDRLLSIKNVVALPHLGASTKEAEENCAYMAAIEIKEYLETGNIRNSVNYPSVNMPFIDKERLTIAHKNIPNMVGQITSRLAGYNLNIANMVNRSKGEWAYTIIDLDNYIEERIETDIVQNIMQINGVKKVRFIQHS